MNLLKTSILMGVFLSCFSGFAQDLQQVLTSVEENNKEIVANQKYWEAERISYYTGINPDDPEVQYGWFPAQDESLGPKTVWGVSQSIDFPTVYTNKRKLAEIQSKKSLEAEKSFRQATLLEAKQIYIEVVLLNAYCELLKKRTQNLDEIVRFFETRLALGAATKLELNKTKLERISLVNELRLKQLDRDRSISNLTRLNGGVRVEITAVSYLPEALIPVDSLLAEALRLSPEVMMLQTESQAALRSLKLSRAAWLPKITVGYEQEQNDFDNYRGPRLGLSIPLWSKGNSVKLAKAKIEHAEASIASFDASLAIYVRNRHAETTVLSENIAEYQTLIGNAENETMLLKAVKLGEINMLQFLQEMDWFYDQYSLFFELQKSYYLNLAELYKHRL